MPATVLPTIILFQQFSLKSAKLSPPCGEGVGDGLKPGVQRLTCCQWWLCRQNEPLYHVELLGSRQTPLISLDLCRLMTIPR